MNRVVHFEIPAEDAKRAVEFYRRTFGWKIESWGPVDYWLVDTGEGVGINGAIVPKLKEGVFEEPLEIVDAAHAINTVVTIDVPEIDAATKAVEKNGGKITMPKWPVKGIGWLAYFRDTEGNILGLMEGDEKAQ